MIAASYLYVPGDRPEMLARARDRGADALVVDLEDAVAVATKPRARAAVGEWLSIAEPGQGEVDVWVRVNQGGYLELDLAAVVGPALAGVVIPKVHGAAELVRAVEAVALAERTAGLSEGRMRILALIESARGLVFARDVAVCSRLEALCLGEGDLAADLGVRPSRGEQEFLFARSTIVAVSAAFGLEPPIGPVSTDFRDLDDFRASTEALRRMGFGGRQAIHPAQVDIVNEVFRPGPAEVEEARATVAALERAARDGVGVVVDGAGRMVDEAVVRLARRTLAMSDRERRMP